MLLYIYVKRYQSSWLRFDQHSVYRRLNTQETAGLKVIGTLQTIGSQGSI